MNALPASNVVSGARPVRVPLNDLAAQQAPIREAVLEALARLATDARFILGAPVEELERWLAGACGVAAAVGVASGSDALELSLRALGAGPGDGVVTPAFSFIAAAEAIAQTGARPVFCDVDPSTLNATADTMAAALARGRAQGLRVKGLLPVDLFGAAAPAGELATLAAREGLWVLVDAAQALGGSDEAGRPAGAWGAAGCFSFFPTKNLGAWGDGGAVITSDLELAARVRRLRAHGATALYTHAELGRNSRLDALQATVLLTKVPHLAAWQQQRERLAARYLEGLAGLPLRLPHVPPAPARHAWHQFVVRTRAEERRDERREERRDERREEPREEARDALAAFLGERGIEARAYYPVPLHQQRCFVGPGEPAPAGLPVAEDASRTSLALPFHPALSHEAQDSVVEAVRAFFVR